MTRMPSRTSIEGRCAPRAPTLADLRREHTLALARPMIGAPMVGDPRFDDAEAPDPLLTRRTCQYAAALLRRDAAWEGDLSRLYAQFVAPNRVVFRLAGLEPCAIVAEIVLPPHALALPPASSLPRIESPLCREDL